jgi:hypothetical protein
MDGKKIIRNIKLSKLIGDLNKRPFIEQFILNHFDSIFLDVEQYKSIHYPNSLFYVRKTKGKLCVLFEIRLVEKLILPHPNTYNILKLNLELTKEDILYIAKYMFNIKCNLDLSEYSASGFNIDKYDYWDRI